MAASNEMMRPVILSSPEKTALPLAIFCVGISVTIVSSGFGAVSTGCGGGGLAICGAAGPACCGAGPAGCNGGAAPGLGAGGGAADAPGGGGSGCAWMPDG